MPQPGGPGARCRFCPSAQPPLQVFAQVDGSRRIPTTVPRGGTQPRLGDPPGFATPVTEAVVAPRSHWGRPPWSPGSRPARLTPGLERGSPQDKPYYVPPTKFAAVGTTTMPAVGFASIVAGHTSMGTGGLINESSLPASLVNAAYGPNVGADLVFARMRSGVSSAAGYANLQAIARAADQDLAALPNGEGEGQSVSVLGVQRRAQIVNYRSIGATPGILAAALVGGAVVALAFTLATSVRRRRRRPGALEDVRFHPAPPRLGHLVAGIGGRRDRRRGRDSCGGRPRTVAMEPVRTADLRRPEADGPCDGGGPRGRGHAGGGQRGGSPSRPQRGPHFDGSPSPRRVARAGGG